MVILGMMACSEGSPCPGLDPFCAREAKASFTVRPGTTVEVGDQIIADASNSIFDEIDWYLNKVTIGTCNGQDICLLDMNSRGTFELSIRVKVHKIGFHGQSKDKDEKNITVSDPSLECPAGDTAHEGIALLYDEGRCLVMETSDRAECRSNTSPTYTDCQVWSQAAVACDSGTNSGDDWYLPTEAEFKYARSYLGSGSPLSSNSLCVGNSSPCASDPSSLSTLPESFYKIPYAYWTSTDSSTGQHIAINLESGFSFAANDSDARLSVRCVKWVDL